MTDRHAGYIVTLTEDIHEDDDERLVTALQMVKGVLSVQPLVADLSLHLAEMRARQDIEDRLFRALREDDADPRNPS